MTLPASALIASVRSTLSEHCGVRPGQALVAACSGGADSVALVYALHALRSQWPLRKVVFVDHGLRPVTEEQGAAAAAAERAGLSLTVRPVQLRGANRQAEARAMRYKVLAEEADGALVATGHTQTDQAETVLQRLIRGTGLRGLGAIRFREGAVVRPLLQVSREATRGLGLPFADDPSNDSACYQRNRVRHAVMPMLSRENPQVEQGLAHFATAAQQELELIDALVTQLALERADFRGLDPALVNAVLRWRLRVELPQALPPSRGAMAQLVERLVGGGRGAVSLGGGLNATVLDGHCLFGSEQDPRQELVLPKVGHYRFGRLRLELERVGVVEEAGTDAGSDQVYIEAAGLEWPLTLKQTPVSLAPKDSGADELLGHNRVGGASRPLMLVDATGRLLWSHGQVLSTVPEGTQPLIRLRWWEQRSADLA